MDELLRSDEELTQKVIQESKQLAYPRAKFILDVLFLIGLVLMLCKVVVLILNKVATLGIVLPGGSVLWNVIPLLLMVVGGIGSNILKEKYKPD